MALDGRPVKPGGRFDVLRSLCPKDRAQEDDFFYIAMNMHWEPQRLALPDLPAGMRWEKVLDTQGDVVETQTDPLTKSITVPGRCIQVLESTGNPVRKGKKRKEK